MRSLLLLSILLIGFSSCNKEKKAFRNIVGSWYVELFFANGEGENSVISSFEFMECDSPDDEFCDLNIRIVTGDNLAYKYSLKPNFEHVVIKEAGSNTPFKYDIVLFKNKKLIFEYDAYGIGTLTYELIKD